MPVEMFEELLFLVAFEAARLCFLGHLAYHTFPKTIVVHRQMH